MSKPKIKFSFSTDFQLEILRYIIQDKEGGLILKRIKPSYLVLIEHSIIAEGINKYYRKHSKVPSRNILKEVVKELLEGKEYVDLVTKEDIPNINKVIDNLYNITLKDSDFIRDRIYQFSTYVEMKNLNDSFDLTNFEQYEEYSHKIDKILQKSKPKQEDEPLYFIRDVAERQFLRQAEPEVIPSPSWQLNELTNAGGFPPASVLVLLDKPKARKTFMLVNLARGYLKMRKSVLYIDTENGKNQIMDRFVQSSLNKTKKEIYTGEFDKMESRHLRKLSRFGVELVIDRVPAMVTDCNYIKDRIQKLRAQGIDIKVVVIDYLAKMASIAGDKDDFERIGNAYIDAQNLAEEMKLDCIWTANHITRDGQKHRKTRYEENDIAKCVDIVRNSVGIFGLNATEQEDADNIQRLELVVQRDGKPSGRALFHIDVETQRAVEFTKSQRKEYDKLFGDNLEQTLNKSNSNPEANAKKAAKLTNGDI
jgi:replicative DNA helicase